VTYVYFNGIAVSPVACDRKDGSISATYPVAGDRANRFRMLLNNLGYRLSPRKRFLSGT
jgi:hypothetical protein